MTPRKNFTDTQQPTELLRRVLQFDAYTGIGSIPLAFASYRIAPLLGMPVAYLLAKFGIFGLFGVWLYAALHRNPIPRFVGWVAVYFNILVTVESAAVLFLNVFALTLPGKLFLVLQTVAGPVLIAVQYIGLKLKVHHGRPLL